MSDRGSYDNDLLHAMKRYTVGNVRLSLNSIILIILISRFHNEQFFLMFLVYANRCRHLQKNMEHVESVLSRRFLSHISSFLFLSNFNLK